MVTCALIPTNGIGNNLFIISTAIGHAIKNGTYYAFPLPIGNGKANVWQQYLNNCSTLPRLSPYRKIDFEFIERGHRFQEIPIKDNVRLIGYWQSEKYFQHCREEVLKALNFKWNPLQDTISIHVRRGDYLNLTNLFVNLSVDYYRRAIDYCVDKGFKKFLVFSDDIAYCKNIFVEPIFNANLAFEFSEGRNEIEDLQLMSSCSAGHICANSSFSWWSSYLNRNLNKIVVMPKDWFAPNAEHRGEFLSAEDIYPEGCVKL